jgi:anti-sigma factor RsiW
VLTLLSDYVDGELPQAQRDAIDAHLAGCDHCERFGGEFAGVVAAVRRRLGVPPPADPDVSERLLARLGSVLDEES